VIIDEENADPARHRCVLAHPPSPFRPSGTRRGG
jgi:hypothetical protein